MATNPMHVDGKSIADAIDAAVAAAAALAAPATTSVAGVVKEAAAVTAPVTTGVQNPANVAYTQADQTALAAALLSVVSKHNALVASLVASGALHA